MRCKACNKVLSTSESSRTEITGDFVDLCSSCYHVSARSIQNHRLESSDYEVEFNDGEQDAHWLK